MAKKEKDYQKLPGTKKGFLIGRHTLWQGTDHLLHVFSRVGVEDYKRFYFNDIQTIITRKTFTGKIQNALLGCFALAFALPAASIGGPGAAVCAAAAGLFLLLLAVNLFRGPTCETKLRTAVQTEKLHSLHRLKNALKIMDRLRPVIQGAQGAVSREDLNKRPAHRIEEKKVKKASRQVASGKSMARAEGKLS